jgi:nucleotide-binding universal stress UspA family protein
MIKDILVHLDGGGEDETRVAHARMLAEAHESRLVGVLTALLPAFHVLADGSEDGDVARYAADSRVRCEAHLTRVEATQERLSHRFASSAAMQEVRRIDGFPETVCTRMVREARRADLLVATCPYRAGHRRWDGLVEAVLLEGGRPLYLVPPGSPPPDSIRSVLVAWKDERELTRAVAAAMPILAAAASTTLVSVSEPEDSASEAPDGLDAWVEHLRRHGARARSRILDGDGGSVGQLLIEEAHRLDADLIVLGAYGHTRLREWLVGGTTRELLRHGDVPLLVAH